MSVILNGGAPAAVGRRVPPLAVISSDWRATDNAPAGLSPDDPSPRRHAGRPAARLDTRWRQGSDAPFQLDSAAPPAARLAPSGDDGINRSQWRIGDQMPFRMDGVEVERVAPNAAKANSAWRLGDAQRTPLQTGEPQVTPRPDGIGEPKAVGVAVRERRLREHTDDLIQKLQMVPPLGDHVQRLRRGEFRM